MKRAPYIKIVGGDFKGLKIFFKPSKLTRPTSNKSRETLFNWLMHDIKGSTCLDMFAGTGALGIEALSRGENIEIRGFGTYKIIKRKARIGRNPRNSQLVQIPEKNAVRWKMSKTFFNRLNKSFTDNKISDTY